MKTVDPPDESIGAPSMAALPRFFSLSTILLSTDELAIMLVARLQLSASRISLCEFFRFSPFLVISDPYGIWVVRTGPIFLPAISCEVIGFFWAEIKCRRPCI